MPYRGGGPAVQDMAAGQLDLMLDQAANALGPVRAGTVKAYAVMSKDALAGVARCALDRRVRHAGALRRLLARHVGAQGHAEGRSSPSSTPRSMRALADPAVKQAAVRRRPRRFRREQQTPEALAAYHKAEIDKWWPIVRASGLKAQ